MLANLPSAQLPDGRLSTVKVWPTAFSGITFLTRPERVFGANDRVRVAVCGLKSRGKDHVDAFSRVPLVYPDYEIG